MVRDDIPVIGGLDDVVVLALALDLFLEGVAAEVLDEHLGELGIDPGAFREDVARIRRFPPGMLRRIIRRARRSGSAGRRCKQRGRAQTSSLDQQLEGSLA